MRQWLLTFLAVVLLAGCSGKKDEQRSGYPVARIDGEVLTAEQLLRRVPPEFRGAITRQQWLKLVNDWFDDQLLARYGEKHGALADPQVQEKLRQARIKILEDYIRNKIVAPKIKITDEQIEQYYIEHKGDFVRDHDEVRAFHIVVSSKSAADSVKKFLKADSSFCAVAKRFSEEYSPTDSCDLGWFTRRDLLPDLIRPVFRANPGEWVGPIKVEGKYHFFFIVDKGKQGTVRPLDQVRDEIYNRLFAERFSAYMANLLDSLRAAAKIEVDTTAIDSLVAAQKKSAR